MKPVGLIIGPIDDEYHLYHSSPGLPKYINLYSRNNFTINEINMLFAKYGIDGKKVVEASDIHKILKDFERKGHWPTRK